MGKNTFSFDTMTGGLTAISYVEATRLHECECGRSFSFTINWPEGLTSRGSVKVGGVACPSCSAPVMLPPAQYWVDDFRLLSAPLTAN